MLKILIGGIGVILMGAIGSGVWEEILKPFVYFLAKVLLEIMSSLFSGYKDGIYEKASDGFREYPSMFILIFFLAILSVFYQILPSLHPCSQKKNTKSLVIKIMESKNGYLITWFLSIAAMSCLFTFMTQIVFTNKIITFAEKSIKITSPYIQEEERLLLISEFSSMKNFNDFQKFENRLNEIANKNNIDLPKSDLGINLF